jgi:hypothetical protein
MTMSTAAFLCLIALHFVLLIDAFVPFPSLLSVRKLPSSTRYGAPVCTTSLETKIDGDLEGKTSLALGVFIQHTDRCTSPPALPPFPPCFFFSYLLPDPVSLTRTSLHLQKMA